MVSAPKLSIKKGKIKEVTNKRGETRYHVRVRLKGAKTQCGVFSNKTKAREFVQRTEAAIREGRYFKDAEAKKHTVGEMLDRYIAEDLPKKPKSLKKQKAQLLWWKKQLGYLILADVLRSPAYIIEQRDKLSTGLLSNGRIRSPATVVRYLAALSHVFTTAMREWAWIDDNPMRKISKPREPRGRTRFLSTEERERLLEACKKSENPYLYIIVLLALGTGMRMGEILNLQWKDVDFENNRILIRETKNGSPRIAPLIGHLHTILWEFAKRRQLHTFFLFPSKKKPNQPIRIDVAWGKALSLSGIEDFRFHDLRHSFASEMMMNKATGPELQILLGHKSASMTARYSHMSEQYQLARVKEMNDRIFSSVTDAKEGM